MLLLLRVAPTAPHPTRASDVGVCGRDMESRELWEGLGLQDCSPAEERHKQSASPAWLLPGPWYSKAP